MSEMMVDAQMVQFERFDDHVRPLLEDGAKTLDPEIAPLASLAISLKRIADFICGGKDSEGTERMDVVAYIGREIENVAKR
jgi:hypothetical protein